MRIARTRLALALVGATTGCADEYCEAYGVCDGEILSEADLDRARALAAEIPSEDGWLLGEPPTDDRKEMRKDLVWLGKQIFFDEDIGPHETSCGTCHPPEKWFTTDLPYRPAAEPGGKVGGAIPGITSIIDVAYYERHKWEGQIRSLPEQLEGALTSANLVETSAPEIAARVYETAPYADEFAAVWPRDGGDALTFQRVTWALEAYIQKIVSGFSDFDRFIADPDAEFSEDAQRGLALFLRKGCDHCHSGPRLTDDEVHDIGLAPLYDAEGNAIWATRTPTLRNVAMTPPYMHTSDFDTLEDVLWYYDEIDHAAGLDRELDWDLEITDDEVPYLVAFLETLTSNTCSWTDDDTCPPAP